MDVSVLRARLQDAPFDFFSAISSSTSTIHDFQSQWHNLCQDTDHAMHRSLLNDEDMSLAHTTATLLATMAELFVKTEEEAIEQKGNFVSEIEDIFAQLTMADITPYPPSLKHPRSAPSYVPSAYAWLLQNLHDPYPTNEIKERIIRDSGRPPRVVVDWFKDVRRYIGWVAMCKDHFQGSRALAVQAAKHVYLGTHSTSRLSISPNIVAQFEAIRVCLRGMYSVADDNDDLSDGTDDSFTSSSPSPRGYPFDQSHYARSRSSSSTPSLVFSTDDDDNHSLVSFTLDDASATLGKRKKLSDEEECRPLKRSRSGFITAADELVKDIVSVSPATSATLEARVSADTSPSLPQTTLSRKRRLSVAATKWEDSTTIPECDPRPTLRVPKRRLSVSDSQPTPKRPCLPPTVGPRKQAVSTPIPIAHQATPAGDDWFRTFELADTSLSVELFNWDSIVENDAFPYSSLFDHILQSDGQDFFVTDAYQPPTPLDLGVSSTVDPSVLDISSTFTELPPTQLTAPISSFTGPITATTTPVFDFLDVFLSAVNAESAEPYTAPSSSPSAELSLDDTIDLFGESVVMP